jgi:hypothetical protein
MLSRAGRAGRARHPPKIKDTQQGGPTAEVLAFARDPEAIARYRLDEPSFKDIQKVKEDLDHVRALTSTGSVMTVLEKLSSDRSLSPEQKERVLRSLALAKAFLERPGDKAETDYRRINLFHTYDEVGAVLELARVMKLSPLETENALLASIFSDVDKAPGGSGFLLHHVAGAKAAVVMLGKELELSRPEHLAQLVSIVTAIKAHQASPPRFFAEVVEREIRSAIDEQGMDPKPLEGSLTSLKKKIMEPLETAHLGPSRDALELTPEERDLLKRVGLREWTLPRDDTAIAVGAGDSFVNFANVVGIAKIVAIRGPEAPFSDATAQHSVASVLGPNGSAADARTLLPKSLHSFYDRQINATREQVAQAELAVDEWLIQHGKRPDKTPFWRNTPLLKNASKQEVEWAKKLRLQFETALRAQQFMG